MISGLLPLWLLLHLVSPGHSLKCVECYNITAPQCTGQTKDCDGGICMSGLISLGDYTLFGRSCAPNAATCGIFGSITSTSRAVLSTSCCTTAGCTPEELKLGPGLGTKIRGCATDSICNFGDQTFDIDGAVIHLGIVCSSASTVVLQYCTFFLTLGFAMFTAKLFF
ncbi:uncharacterized protein [Dendrobates tinctorius]|uniref:uncharacterized protein isoform X2 n=1 Tax=Dendrobates tinctorius TaxID=92724 RepID=UPI003CCA4C47